MQFVGEPPSAQAETFVQIREIRGQKNLSAQAETFVLIRAIRGQKNHQRKLKHSCKFVRFVGKTPSAQAENMPFVGAFSPK